MDVADGAGVGSGSGSGTLSLITMIESIIDNTVPHCVHCFALSSPSAPLRKPKRIAAELSSALAAAGSAVYARTLAPQSAHAREKSSAVGISAPLSSCSKDMLSAAALPSQSDGPVAFAAAFTPSLICSFAE